MYKLAEGRAAVGGIYCGADGVWLGPAQLIRRSGCGRYQVRAAAEIAALLAAAYGSPPQTAGCIAGLHRIAKHLADSDLPLSMIAAVQLRFGEIAEERIERLARADSLLKANFDPDEPRDDQAAGPTRPKSIQIAPRARAAAAAISFRPAPAATARPRRAPGSIFQTPTFATVSPKPNTRQRAKTSAMARCSTAPMHEGGATSPSAGTS